LLGALVACLYYKSNVFIISVGMVVIPGSCVRSDSTVSEQFWFFPCHGFSLYGVLNSTYQLSANSDTNDVK
jgi:hypothetical protein